jgi:hypothetical protein
MNNVFQYFVLENYAWKTDDIRSSNILFFSVLNALSNGVTYITIGWNLKEPILLFPAILTEIRFFEVKIDFGTKFMLHTDRA